MPINKSKNCNKIFKTVKNKNKFFLQETPDFTDLMQMHACKTVGVEVMLTYAT